MEGRTEERPGLALGGTTFIQTRGPFSHPYMQMSRMPTEEDGMWLFVGVGITSVISKRNCDM